MKPNLPWNVMQRTLSFALAVLLCGAPELLAQSTQAPPPQNNTQQNSQTSSPTNGTQSDAQQNQSQQQAAPAQKPPASQSLDVDPAKGPLQPVTPPSQDTTLPNAPSATQQQSTQTTVPPPQAQTEQKPAAPSAPQGVAVAGEAKTNGGPASKPAGTAIAPAKQSQKRSLLIKIGAIGAGAAALGAIYGLTRSTPARPPNASNTGGVIAH